MALFRVIISGTRYFNDYSLLKSYTDKVEKGIAVRVKIYKSQS